MQQNIQIVNSDRKITKIVLDDLEWETFVKSLYDGLISEKITPKAAEEKCKEIREQQCVPLLAATAVGSATVGKITTPIVGIVNGIYGDLFYRAWWAENGGANGTAQVNTELGDPTKLAGDFKTWFSKLHLGTTMVEKFAVNKKSEHFDISAVRAWIAKNQGLDLDGGDLKIVRMKAWVWSAELVALWFHSSIIKSDGSGFFF